MAGLPSVGALVLNERGRGTSLKSIVPRTSTSVATVENQSAIHISNTLVLRPARASLQNQPTGESNNNKINLASRWCHRSVRLNTRCHCSAAIHTGASLKVKVRARTTVILLLPVSTCKALPEASIGVRSA